MEEKEEAGSATMVGISVLFFILLILMVILILRTTMAEKMSCCQKGCCVKMNRCLDRCLDGPEVLYKRITRKCCRRRVAKTFKLVDEN